MRPLVTSRYDYDSKKQTSEKVLTIGETTPNMSYTVNEMLQRFANGQPLSKLNGLEFTGEGLLPNPKTLDLVDHEEMIRQTQHRIEILKEQEAKLQEKHKLRVEQENKEQKEAIEYYRQLNNQHKELTEFEKLGKPQTAQ